MKLLRPLWLSVALLASHAPAMAQDDDDPFGDLEAEVEAEDEGSGEAEDADTEDADTEDADTEDADTKDADTGDAEGLAAEDDGDSGPAVAVTVAAGLGVGTRSFERPTDKGAQRLPEASFPAAEVLGRVHIWPADSFSLEALIVYQTSLGMAVTEPPPFALPERIDTRSAHAEISLAPAFRLGNAADAPRLLFPLGFVARTFNPAVHHQRTPGYTLAGPALRAELDLRLGEVVDLRFGPEAQFISLIAGSIVDDGVCCQGFAIGGQGSVDARIGEHFALGLAFRQSHAFAPSTGAAFVDVERMLTTRLQGRL